MSRASPLRFGNPAAALLASVLGSSLATALAVMLLLARDMTLPPDAYPLIFILALLVALLVLGLAAIFIGLPVMYILNSNRVESAWSYALAGFTCGAALILLLPILSGDRDLTSNPEFLPVTLTGALPGALCGALWWFLHRRHVQDHGDQSG